LNGYKVEDIIGKTATSLEMAIIVSIMPDGFMNKIKETVSQHFSFKEITYHSFNLAAFSVIRDLFPDKDNYMFLDLSSEISDISMVRDGILMGSASFPLGRNFFVRKISSALNISLEETFSLISIFHHKNLDDITTAKIETVLSDAMNEWVAEMQKSLALLAREVYIPRTIFKITTMTSGYFLPRD
jgi:cell division ATPase FtsA